MPFSKRKGGRGGRQRKTNVQRQKESQGGQKKQEQPRAESPEAATGSLSTKVLRVAPRQRAKWPLLSISSRKHLESTIHWLIRSLLHKTTEDDHETERHLNHLKKRLFKRFENLRVPRETQSCLKYVPTFLAKEETEGAAIEEALVELQEEIDQVVQAIEHREETIQRLQQEIQELKSELAAEEAAACKLFHEEGENVLALPDVSMDCHRTPILQNELLKVKNQQGLLDDLNTIQQSNDMKAVSGFLEQSYENVDLLEREAVP